MKRDSEEWKILVMAAAKHRSQGKEQKEIAEALKVLQPTVSRLLADAAAWKWLTLTFHEERCDPDLLKRMQTRFLFDDALARRVRHALKDLVRTVIVLDAASEDAFYAAAQDAVAPLLARARLLGVTWGRSIHNLVQAMKARTTPLPRPRTPIRFFPVCGEPFQSRTSQEYSSSFLVETLHHLWNTNKDPRPPSIAGVPAFIPGSFDDDERAVIMKIIARGAGYREVFQGSDALIEHADTLLTSAGVPDPKYRGIFLQERCDLGDLAEKDLRWLLGDLGGLIVARNDAPPAVRNRVDAMNERWTGVKRKHLAACASKSLRGDPGVVVVVWYLNRLPLLYRCIHDRLINTLVISQGMAARLEELLARGAEPE
jgi:hypothetical protein